MKKMNIKTILAIGLFIVIAILFSSCQKETGITEAEATDLIAMSLSSTSNGLNYRIAIDDSIVATDSISCGETKTFTNSIMNPSGTTSTYTYNTSATQTLTCTSTQTLATSVNASGNFDAPRVAATDIVTGSWTLSGFEGASSTLIFNGNYKRSGTANSKVIRQAAYSYELITTSSNIIYDKTSNKITTGTATVALNGSATFRGTFNYTASIEFLGNDLAKVIINGTVYTINLLTGQII
jgi:hypothetical protein